jgi:tRNA A37 threonylcarbamoyladenosine dehydratase
LLKLNPSCKIKSINEKHTHEHYNHRLLKTKE